MRSDRVERAAVSFGEGLEHLGITLHEGMRETPMRFAKLLAEFSKEEDFQALLKTFDYNEKPGGLPMVIQEAIPLVGLCEHHLCPYFGDAFVGIIPGKEVVGLSKIARLVEAVGRRSPSIQEHLTNDIADILDEKLSPKGVIVVTKAEHTCMTVRGANKPGVRSSCSAIRGAYVHNPHARDEFFNILRLK